MNDYVTHNIRAANAAADTAAHEVIDQYDVNVGTLAIVILQELRRQERAYYDRLNDTAPVPVYGPEEECPV